MEKENTFYIVRLCRPGTELCLHERSLRRGKRENPAETHQVLLLLQLLLLSICVCLQSFLVSNFWAAAKVFLIAP